MLWFGPLKGTFYLSTASIMFVCVCWTTAGQVFNVLTSAYRHAARSCDAPLAWDANFALKEQTRDGVDGSQMSHVCLTVDPIVAQHPTKKKKKPGRYIQEYLALQRVLPPQVCLDHPGSNEGNQS